MNLNRSQSSNADLTTNELSQQMAEMKAELEKYKTELSELRQQFTLDEQAAAKVVQSRPATSNRRRLLKQMAAGAAGISALGLAAAVNGAQQFALAETPADTAIEAVGGPDGFGVKASGGAGQIRLVPFAGNTFPTTTETGILVARPDGVYYAVSNSAWRKLAGTATAGALHMLDVPVRAIDSRVPTGTVSGGGGNGRMTANTERTYVITGGANPAPAGATAIVGNLTISNPAVAEGSQGFATLWTSGVRPGISTLSYFTNGRSVSNSFNLKLAADGTFKVFTLRDADIVIDVTGYYL